MDSQTVDRFVESWGSMGVLWGINRSMARIHALLIASAEPLGLDEIATRLQISRGNTSMCLKELRSWEVIQRVHMPGDRKDYYVSESDVWSMLFRIAAERKRREFDPALGSVRDALADSEDDGGPVRERLQQMESLLGTMDRVANQFLANERTSRGMLQFLTGQIPNSSE
jgi:DNA-binding transcriptional regulator GbsR (MarR family)